MVILRSELKTYGELDDFILDGYWGLFKEVFGFTPTDHYIKDNLKKVSNWMSDVEIIEKILDTLPDKYVVGEWYESYEYWAGGSYAMNHSSVIWVHKIIEEGDIEE